MIIAICSPGQSMVRRWAERNAPHDLVLTVNAAAKVVESDWVCAADKVWYRGLFGDTAKRPRIGYLTAPDAINDAKAYDPGKEMRDWPSVPLIGRHHEQGRPIAWSIQSAMCFAAQLGARHVILYGADGAKSVGTIDASGYKGEDRTDDRWAREERDMAFTTEMLAGEGISVERIAP
jgi:hypothetical protein